MKDPLRPNLTKALFSLFFHGSCKKLTCFSESIWWMLSFLSSLAQFGRAVLLVLGEKRKFTCTYTRLVQFIISSLMDLCNYESIRANHTQSAWFLDFGVTTWSNFYSFFEISSFHLIWVIGRRLIATFTRWSLKMKTCSIKKNLIFKTNIIQSDDDLKHSGVTIWHHCPVWGHAHVNPTAQYCLWKN